MASFRMSSGSSRVSMSGGGGGLASMRAGSVYGGAGGMGVRVSSGGSSRMSAGFGMGGGGGGGPGTPGRRIPDAPGHQEQTGDGDRRVQETAGRRGQRECQSERWLETLVRVVRQLVQLQQRHHSHQDSGHHRDSGGEHRDRVN